MYTVRATVNGVLGDVRYSCIENGVRKWHRVTTVETIDILCPKKIVYTNDNGVNAIHFKSKNGDSLYAPVLSCYFDSCDRINNEGIFATIGGEASE